MERERPLENDRSRNPGDGPSSDDSFNETRSEIEGLFETADQMFDAIDNPQQYLEQNLQTGGQ